MLVFYVSPIFESIHQLPILNIQKKSVKKNPYVVHKALTNKIKYEAHGE